MENTIAIQPATIAQLHLLRQLAISTFLDTYAAMNTEENMRSYLDNAFSAGRLASELQNPLCQYWLADSQQELAGYFKINFCGAQSDIQDPDSLELERIYVLSKYKGQGIGKRLIQKAIDVAKEHGMLGLWLGVWEKNEAAIHFYEKMGFKKTGLHSFVLGDDEQRDFVMKFII